jgi:PIN domain nuclease of toxin-antitoxin system
VRILLDTHLALWAVVGSERLSQTAREVILAADEVFVSAASLWEVAIKHALGKGDMPVSAELALAAFTDAGYTLLAVKAEHAVRVETLPPIHKDPFDRLLVAQAMAEPLTLLTHDAVVSQYSPGIVLV